MMKKLTLAGAAFAMGAAAIVPAAPAMAQTTPDWTGPYVGVFIGGNQANDQGDERLRFDRNLDGNYGETVSTAAGADAFLSRLEAFAGVLDGGSGGHAQARLHLVGDDHRQCGLTEPGRTGEQDMVRGATATASGSEYQAKLIGDPLLALELGQGAGSQGDLLSLLRGICPRRHR